MHMACLVQDVHVCVKVNELGYKSRKNTLAERKMMQRYGGYDKQYEFRNWPPSGFLGPSGF